MRIRCIALEPSPELQKQLGDRFPGGRTDYDLDLLREYVALGIGFWDGIAWAEIATDGGWILSVPLELFEITEPTASRYWQLRFDARGMTLWPPFFYESTLNSELADDVPEAVEKFRSLKAQIEAEALGIGA